MELFHYQGEPGFRKLRSLWHVIYQKKKKKTCSPRYLLSFVWKGTEELQQLLVGMQWHWLAMLFTLITKATWNNTSFATEAMQYVTPAFREHTQLVTGIPLVWSLQAMASCSAFAESPGIQFTPSHGARRWITCFVIPWMLSCDTVR